jgi:hypothetical protein
MKSFVCLAISCLLIGLLYVYVRQQFAIQTTQISQLTGIIRSMAVEMTPEPKKEEPAIEVAKLGPERIDVSDDSESDDDSDCDSEHSSTEVEPEISNFVVDDFVDPPKLSSFKVDQGFGDRSATFVVDRSAAGAFIIERPADVIHGPEVVELSLLEETVLEPPRQIVIETNYESWSMKDLKEKISQMGGPNLKTKKLMLEFLEKSVQ